MRILSNTVVYVFTFDLCKRGWVEFINKSTQLMLKLKYNNYRVCLTDGLIFFVLLHKIVREVHLCIGTQSSRHVHLFKIINTHMFLIIIDFYV